MLKKTDFIIFAVIIALSAALFVVSFGKSGGKVVVKTDNKIYGSYNLNKNQTVKIATNSGENTLVIKNGEAYFINSNCPDKTCQKMGKIKLAGETIVCLPHKVVAEVQK